MNKTCDCRSYNAGVGTTPETILNAPKWSNKTNGICIDSCIAPVIEHLWENGVVTLGSCCGHNGLFCRSIVLGENESDYRRIRDLIAEKDSRIFELTQWRRVIV